MYIVRTSPRAFVAAMAPLVLFHAVIVAIDLLGQLAPSGGPPTGLPTPDAVLILFLLRVSLDVALFLLGHCEARRALLSSRATYALIGGGAALLGYAMATGFGLSLGVRPAGTVLTAGVLPVLFGLLTGFLYGQFAGLEPIDAAVEPQETHEAADPIVPILRYDGPIQVRTSIAGIAIAATVPAAFVFIIAFPLMMMTAPVIDHGAGASVLSAEWIIALGLPAQLFILTLLVAALPAALSALAIHGLARTLALTRTRNYAGCGALVGVALSLLFSPLNPFTALYYLVVPSVLIGALMGITYRRFAGVEPLPLPEPVLVRDIEAVVPEDHPDRSTHQIVLNG